ncbi:phage tail tape measure protein [Streptomyces sp. NPDC050507]|uniref:phage tail tape measure protein n=1 Tax=Streptomyces sp. NPDC050507 TaxID=3365619 RepID=UPI0037A4495B
MSRAGSRGARGASQMGGAGALAAGAMLGPWGAAAGALSAAGAKIYEVGATYEQSLNQIQALSDSTNAQMQTLQGQLNGMSGGFAAMGYSTGDAASAMVELIKAGQTSDQALQSLTATMQLAKAGGIDTAEAASYMSDSINAFGLGAKDAADVANTLAQAANVSSSDIGDFGYALQASGAVAHNAGLSFAETNALLVEMSNSGLKGSDAGTSLKTMLMRLSAPTKEVNKELKKLGVSVYDSGGKMRNIRDIIGQLSSKTKNLSEEQRNAAFNTVFGADAIRAANVVVGGGVKKFDQYHAAVQKAGGAQKAAEAATQGFSGAMARAKAVGTSAMQQLYMGASPLLAKALNGILDIGGKVASSFRSIGGAGALMGGVRSAITGIKTGFDALFAGFVSGGGPAAVSGIFNTIRDAISRVSGVVQNTFIPWFRDQLPKIKPVVQQVGVAIASYMDYVKTAIQTVVLVVSAIWSRFGGTFMKVATNSFNTVLGVIRGAFKVIQGIFQIFSGLLSGDWSKMWAGIKNVLSGAKGILLSLAKGLWNSIVTSARDVIPRLLSAGKDMVSGIWRGISSLSGWLAGKARAWAKESILDPVKNFFGISSPSRLMAEQGKWVGLGFAQGLSSTTRIVAAKAIKAMRPVHSALYKSTTAAIAADGKQLKKLEGQHKKSLKWIASLEKKRKNTRAGSSARKKVDADLKKEKAKAKKLEDQEKSVAARMKKARDNFAKSVAAAQEKLKAVQAQYDDTKANVRKAILDSVNVAQAPEGQTVSVATIFDKLREGAAKARKFAADIDAMRKKGVDADLIGQIVSQGMDAGGDAAAALAAATPEQLKAINQQQAALESAAGKAGTNAADALYGAGVQAAKGLVAGLQKEQKSIDAQMAKIAKGMETAIKKALGIKSPSRLMAVLGRQSAAGMVKGLEDGTADVARASSLLADTVPGGASSGGRSRLGAYGAGGATPVNVYVTVQGHVTAERDLARSIAGPVRDEIIRIGKRNGGRTGL